MRLDQMRKLFKLDGLTEASTGDAGTIQTCAANVAAKILHGEITESFRDDAGNFVFASEKGAVLVTESGKVDYRELTERNRDGTGPEGKGPRTGRKKGKCKPTLESITDDVLNDVVEAVAALSGDDYDRAMRCLSKYDAAKNDADEDGMLEAFESVLASLPELPESLSTFAEAMEDDLADYTMEELAEEFGSMLEDCDDLDRAMDVCRSFDVATATNDMASARFAYRTLCEVLGYKIKAADKKIIKAFIGGAKTGQGNVLEINGDTLKTMSLGKDTIATRSGAGLVIPGASGNVTQTFVNAVRKAAKAEGITLAEAKTSDMLWMRLGDGDDYNEFGIDISSAAESAAMAGVEAPLKWTKNGFSADGFSGNGYVSLFWGDKNADFVRSLSTTERKKFERALDESDGTDSNLNEAVSVYTKNGEYFITDKKVGDTGMAIVVAPHLKKQPKSMAIDKWSEDQLKKLVKVDPADVPSEWQDGIKAALAAKNLIPAQWRSAVTALVEDSEAGTTANPFDLLVENMRKSIEIMAKDYKSAKCSSKKGASIAVRFDSDEEADGFERDLKMEYPGLKFKRQPAGEDITAFVIKADQIKEAVDALHESYDDETFETFVTDVSDELDKTPFGRLIVADQDQYARGDIENYYKENAKDWFARVSKQGSKYRVRVNTKLVPEYKRTTTGLKSELDTTTAKDAASYIVSAYKAAFTKNENVTQESVESGYDVVFESFDQKTVLAQLGGSKALYMIGAKNIGFSKTDNYVSMKVMKNKSGGNYLTIKLNGKDLYDVELVSMRGDKRVVKAEENDVYAEDLRATVERMTGLYLSMGTMGKTQESISGNWAKTVTNPTKGPKGTGKLIATWQDLAAYYDFDDEIWAYHQSGNWSNEGANVATFKAQIGKRWRGKLAECDTMSGLDEAQRTLMIKLPLNSKYFDGADEETIMRAAIEIWPNFRSDYVKAMQKIVAMRSERKLAASTESEADNLTDAVAFRIPLSVLSAVEGIIGEAQSDCQISEIEGDFVWVRVPEHFANAVECVVAGEGAENKK